MQNMQWESRNMEIAYSLGNVEAVIYKMDMMDVADDIMESDEDYQIVISGWWVHIPELGLNLHEGIYCNYDDKQKEYLPDFAVTVIKKEGQEHEEWLYYEQDGFIITLANWLGGKVEFSRLEQMKCLICKPE